MNVWKKCILLWISINVNINIVYVCISVSSSHFFSLLFIHLNTDTVWVVEHIQRSYSHPLWYIRWYFFFLTKFWNVCNFWSSSSVGWRHHIMDGSKSWWCVCIRDILIQFSMFRSLNINKYFLIEIHSLPLSLALFLSLCFFQFLLYINLSTISFHHILADLLSVRG